MALACILVLKYRKADEDSLMEKISKLNIHSIIKKSSRVSSHLKHLTGFAPQVSPEGSRWHELARDPSWCLLWFGRLVQTGPCSYQTAYNLHRGKLGDPLGQHTVVTVASVPLRRL